MSRSIVKKLAFIVLACFVLSFAFAGCGAKTETKEEPAASTEPKEEPKKEEPKKEEPKAEPVKIVYWMFGDPTIEAEKGLPKEKWYITGAIERFEKANPDIKVELLILPQDGLGEKFKASGIAQNGPDITNLWVGAMLSDNKQFILPLDKYFTADDLKNVGGELAVRLGYDTQGPLMGMPSGNDSLVMFYNKAMFKAAGVDEGALPKTMDELYAVCEKIKATGKTPMVFGDKEGYYSAFMMLPIYASVTGAQGLRDIIEGKTTFSGDPNFIATAKAWQDLYKKGYTNKDVASLDDSGAQSKFANGGAAIISTGQWLIPSALATLKDDLGMMKIPSLTADAKYPGTIVGGPGQCYVVTSYSKYPDQAVKFMKFLISKEEEETKITQREHGTGATPYKYVSPDVFTDPFSKQLQEFSKDSLLIPWMDNQLPAEVAAEFYRLSPLLLSAKMTPEEYAKKLDEQMQKVAK